MQEYRSRVLGPRQPADHGEPVLVARACGESLHRHGGKFAKRHILFGGGPCDVRQQCDVAERHQGFGGQPFVLEPCDQIAEQHACLLQWTRNASLSASTTPSILARETSLAMYCAIARRS